MRDPSDDRFPGVKSAGLAGIVVVGVFFIALGLHARSTGLSHDRPTRPYLQIGIGSVMLVSAGAELIRRWWRDRAGARRR